MTTVFVPCLHCHQQCSCFRDHENFQKACADTRHRIEIRLPPEVEASIRAHESSSLPFDLGVVSACVACGSTKYDTKDHLRLAFGFRDEFIPDVHYYQFAA